MDKKYKYILFSLLLAGILLSLSQPVLALEVEYPPLNPFGAPSPYQITENTSLVQYIEYVFIFFITIAGVLGVLSIAISGLSILFTAGNPEYLGEAKKRILSAILGIVLLMTSFIILRTINPQLINDANDGLGRSVWYKSPHPTIPNVHVWTPAPQAEKDTSNLPSGTQLFYYCENLTGPTLLVSKYALTNFQPSLTMNGVLTPWTETKEVICNTGIPISATPNLIFSFKWEYKEPGLYFYTNNNCEGLSSPVQKSSGNIPPFSKEATAFQAPRSLMIVSGEDSRMKYGVILNKSTEFSGVCSNVEYNLVATDLTKPYSILNPNTGKCILLTTGAGPILPTEAYKSIYIVNFDTDYALRTNDSVKFYSKDFSAEIKQQAAAGDPPILGTTNSIPAPPPEGAKDIGQFLEIDSNFAVGAGNNFNPSRVIRPKKPGTEGRGVRYTTKPYATIEEEDYADENGVKVGSAYFDGSSPSYLNFFRPFPAGRGGYAQCNDLRRECIRSLAHNGLYYTVLYAANPNTFSPTDRTCSVIGGPVPNIKVQFDNVSGLSRIIQKIAIIPTTP
ncbi:MAG: pilin [bacterium]|nr:pilin [bacterium]